jgi:Flp pilus assembly protein CpaB
MNTKKIWAISIILGLMVAVFAYITIFSKGKATSAAVEAKVTQLDINKKTVNNGVKNPTIPPRDFKNPIVEVSKGERAVSIKVNSPEQGVSGYIESNSRVDVIAYESTKDDKTSKTYRSADLILENVKVLTSGKSSDSKDNALLYDTVTLEVTPEQGVLLSLASRDKDGFYLMLRNSKDEETGKSGIKQTREVIN